MSSVRCRRPARWWAFPIIVLGGFIPARVPGCAERPTGSPPLVTASVVWVAGALAPQAAEFTGMGNRGVAGTAIGVYGVSTPDDARRLCATLATRGDGIIIGLGRAMLPVLRDLQRHDARLWLGFDAPGVEATGLTAWWAPAESLRAEIARSAAQVSPQVTVVGSSVSSAMLRALKDAGIPVVPMAPNPAAGVGIVVPSQGSVLVADPVALPSSDARRIFWACESPFHVPERAAAAITMDWGEAVRSALGWHLRREGVPPGATLGRWIGMRSTAHAS